MFLSTPFFKEELSNIKLKFEEGEYTFNYTFTSLFGDKEFIKYYNNYKLE